MSESCLNSSRSHEVSTRKSLLPCADGLSTTVVMIALLGVIASGAWGCFEQRAETVDLTAEPKYPWNSAVALDATETAFLLPDFLSAEEVERVRSLAAPGLDKQPQGPYQSTLLKGDHFATDPILAEIDRRIGRLSGIPPHASESALRVSRTSTWGRRGGPQVQNLHHDTAKAAKRRVATLLVYLSDASDGLVGGGTLFPCLDAAEEHAHEAVVVPAPTGTSNMALSRAQACSRLGDALDRGEDFLAPPGSFHQQPCFDKGAAIAASNMCGAPSGASATLLGAVRVEPRRGTGLFFLSASPLNGTTLKRAWHGSCRVGAGQKWTMQKFKELVPGAGDEDEETRDGGIEGEARFRWPSRG